MKQNRKQEKEKEKKGKRPQGSYSAQPSIRPEAQLAKTRNGTWPPPLSLSLTAQAHTSSPSSSPFLLSPHGSSLRRQSRHPAQTLTLSPRHPRYETSTQPPLPPFSHFPPSSSSDRSRAEPPGRRLNYGEELPSRPTFTSSLALPPGSPRPSAHIRRRGTSSLSS
jgi:hypothetical protein